MVRLYRNWNPRFYDFQKINIGMSLGFKVKNASIEETALWIKSQNGQTFKVVRDKYGGQY